MSRITYQLSPHLHHQTATSDTVPDKYTYIKLPFADANLTYDSGPWGTMINQWANIADHIYEEQYFEPLEDMEVFIVTNEPFLALHCMLDGNLNVRHPLSNNINLKKGRLCLHYVPATEGCSMTLLAGEKYHYFYIVPDIHFLALMTNDYEPLQSSIQAIRSNAPEHKMLAIKRLSVSEHAELTKMKTSMLRGEALITYHSNRISDLILLYLEQLDLPVSREVFLAGLYEKEIDALMVRIETNPEEMFPVSELALQIGISNHTLETAFKLRRGTTLLLYVQQQRIRMAKQLLSTTGEAIAGIALKVGYADQSYFARLFKRETGSTPSDYRKDNSTI